MATRGDSNELVTLQDAVISTSFEVAALVNLLVKKGIITHEEMLDEIKAMVKDKG